MEKIQAWSDKINLHFWHSASTYKSTETRSDDEALKRNEGTGSILEIWFVLFLVRVALSVVWEKEHQFSFVSVNHICEFS